ncbi:MAG TPA: alpha-L-fucosidase [Acidimicrobiales bacterium]
MPTTTLTNPVNGTSTAFEGRPIPQWFDDAKFGVFVHWTAAAVPAFAPVGRSVFDLAAEEGQEAAFARSPYVEWYQNSLAIDGSPVQLHHAATYGTQPYDEFVREFSSGHRGWNPNEWADLFARAGARYVVLVTKHHDGVLLWPSAHSNPHKRQWQSDRDIVGELATAVRERDMRFGTYYSGGLDWTFGGLPITDFSSMLAAIPQTADYLEYVDAHWRELIERYEPSVLWNDIGYPAAADLDGLFTSYYDRVPDGVVNNRFDWIRQSAGQVHADFLTPEYSTAGAPGRKWESTRGIGTSFGYNREERDEDYLSADALVRMLVEVVAHGGNLLLNAGPAGDGTIPFVQVQRLLALGWWLRVNGDAIYGTRPWHTPRGTAGGGIDVCFTRSNDALHAIVLGTPSSSVVELPDVEPADDAVVTQLGRSGNLSWRRAGQGIEVDLSGRPPRGPAFTLRVSPAPPADPGPAAVSG